MVLLKEITLILGDLFFNVVIYFYVLLLALASKLPSA